MNIEDTQAKSLRVAAGLRSAMEVSCEPFAWLQICRKADKQELVSKIEGIRKSFRSFRSFISEGHSIKSLAKRAIACHRMCLCLDAQSELQAHDIL